MAHYFGSHQSSSAIDTTSFTVSGNPRVVFGLRNLPGSKPIPVVVFQRSGRLRNLVALRMDHAWIISPPSAHSAPPSAPCSDRRGPSSPAAPRAVAGTSSSTASRQRWARPRERGLPRRRVRDRRPAEPDHGGRRPPQGAALAGSRIRWTASERGVRHRLESSVKGSQPR